VAEGTGYDQNGPAETGEATMTEETSFAMNRSRNRPPRERRFSGRLAKSLKKAEEKPR